MQVNEDKLYELIQDVKVELEESESQFIDDLNDEDYGKVEYFATTKFISSKFHSSIMV